MAGLPSGFRSIVERPLSGPGKGLHKGEHFRWSVLPLIVCGAVCGRYEHAVPAAAALDLWMAAADVFDDVEDRDAEDALWRTHGQPQAINAATALLLLTQLALGRLRDRGVDADTVVSVMREVCAAGLRACGGQHHDFLYESRPDLTEDEYLRLIEMKSASLVECACRVGAMLGTTEHHLVSLYAGFGRNVGLAAQLANDARSFQAAPALRQAQGERGTQAARGEPVEPERPSNDLTLGQAPGSAKSDIRRRKVTLPVIYGLATAEETERGLLLGVFSGETAVTPEVEGEVRRVLARSGAIHYALLRADIYKQRALKALEDTGLSSPQNEDLKRLVAL